MLKLTTLRLPASSHPKANPLPFFRQAERNTTHTTHESFLESDKEWLGFETAPRFLPYLVQDEYSRANTEHSIPAIELENEHLKAVFLPQYGARLYSLFDKDMQRELLFKNPVIQPANLAILDAWIAGGIEWNVGKLGHAPSTSSPVYCASMQDKNGEEFLRAYEYEQMRGLFWHIDFHLPKGSRMLKCYIRMVNDTDSPSPLYYWTNIAMPEESKTRVFSAADEVLYLNMDTQEFGRKKMPHLPTMPAADASYPQNFLYSNEYFFQTDKDEATPWEAAVYPDNWMFFEQSTQPLRYRKMFCWGTHKGGQQWKDHLALPGQGDYVEIQAGISPTQLHGAEIGAHSEIEFVQCFGGLALDTEPFYNPDWFEARDAVFDTIARHRPADATANDLQDLQQYSHATPTQLLYQGSGYSALHAATYQTAKTKMPQGFAFPAACITREYLPWLHLLRHGVYPGASAGTHEIYVQGDNWLNLLQTSLQTPQGQTPAAYLQYGTMLMEECKNKNARAAFEKSLQLSPSALALRNLALLDKREGKTKDMLPLYQKALQLATPEEQLPLCVEYYALLVDNEEYKTLWAHYSTLSDKMKTEERLALSAGKAALALGELEFAQGVLSREFAYIRENSNQLSDMWIELHQKLWQKEHGQAISASDVESKFPVPSRLDFRMR